MNGRAVAEIIELIGSSPKGREDATENALAEPAKTIEKHQVSIREAVQCKGTHFWRISGSIPLTSCNFI